MKTKQNPLKAKLVEAEFELRRKIGFASKSDRERQISYDDPYMWDLKKWYKWIYLQNRNRLTDLENKLMVTKEERCQQSDGGRDKLGVRDWHIYTTIFKIREGNGNPLQSSCLENPRDRGVWWTVVCGVTQGRTRLKRLSSSSIFKIDNQQRPTVQHRELWSIFCNSVNGKRIWKRIDTCICITESLCWIPESNTTLLVVLIQYKIKI